MKIFHKIFDHLKTDLTERMRSKKSRLGRRGQVAVVLLVMISAGLVFYAVSLNLGRASQTKTTATMASNIAASQLASEMSSYGQNLFMSQMGGKKKICGWTGLLGALVAVIVAIVSIVTFGGTLALLALVLAIASAGLQVAVIQPGITSLWDKISQTDLSISDQFMENAIRLGLQNAVNDPGVVPDFFDMDTDGVFGLDQNGKPRDTVSRFAYYYTNRLQSVSKADPLVLQGFLNKLRDFLYVTGANDWGIHDRHQCPNVNDPCCLAPGSSNIPAYCDPCCLPESIPDPSDVNAPAIQIRPDCCGLNGQAKTCGGDPTTCSTRSAYGQSYYNGNNYAFDYDPQSENKTNNIYSFRELLGQDDANPHYHRTLVNGNFALQQTPATSAAQDGISINDATGYYSNPPDTEKGIFSFFHRINEWGVDLSDTTGRNNPNDPRCNWCDSSGGTTCSTNMSSELAQMSFLTPHSTQVQINPPMTGSAPNTVTYNNTSCVDGVGTYTPDPTRHPLAVDKFSVPPGIVAQSGDCAQGALYPTSTSGGFWKPGDDSYCNAGDPPGSTSWPYYSKCPKHGSQTCNEVDSQGNPIASSVDCSCGKGNSVPALFNDDVLDDIGHGLPEFVKWAENLLIEAGCDLSSTSSQCTNLNSMMERLPDWYEEAAHWIEPKGPDGPNSNCFLCDLNQEGYLYVWKKELNEMVGRLGGWFTQSYAGSSCDEVWCVPPQNGPLPTGSVFKTTTCPDISTAEQVTFNYNHNNTMGDVDDLISCLSANVDGYVRDSAGSPLYINPTGTNRGNDWMFEQCGKTCSVADCQFLPRSLLSRNVYNPFAFNSGQLQDPPVPAVPAAGNESIIAKIIACVTPGQCNNINCQQIPQCSDGSSYPCPTGTVDYFSGTNIHNIDFVSSGFCDASGNVTCQANSNPGSFSCTALQNLQQIVHSISDPGTPGDGRCNFPWILKTQQSAQLAKNQVIKFRQRRDFLLHLRQAGGEAFNVLNTAAVNFNDFLGSPQVQGLINQLKNSSTGANVTVGIPYQAIYGWQDPVTKTNTSKAWHFVRVDARLPGKCDGACNVDQNPHGGDPRWPRIRTYTKNWGTKRCYELSNTEGVVKFRVMRYDQPSSGGKATFGSGGLLWDFNRSNELEVALNQVEARCSEAMAHDPITIPPTPIGSYFSGAFLLNNPTDHSECYDTVSKILKYGEVSQTCAKYYYKGGARKGMGLKFIDCSPF